MTIRASLVFSAMLAAICAGGRAPVQAAPATLVVLVIVDQLRGDYIDAFGEHFCDGGFNRLRREGAWFSNAHFEYGHTATGPGHATVSTGVPPAVHGIVANDWIEFSSNGPEVYCCRDESAQCVGLPEGKRGDSCSPRNLRAPTLGDAMKSATSGRGKVWSIALKDRSAILPAGMRGDGAVWFDDGLYVSSSYYGAALPTWAAQLNAEHFADRFLHQTWDRLLPAGLYGPRFLVAPGAERTGQQSTLPKSLGGASSAPDKKYFADLLNSPFGNELVWEAARRALVAEQLGADAAPDLLCLGLSSNDIVGHAYGPDSDEVMDCTLRTDRQLADFLTWLDERVGSGKYLVALSADHGVGPLTEQAVALGLGGGRLHSEEVAKFIEHALRERYASAEGARLVRGVSLPWIYLDEPAIKSAGLDLNEVARTTARSLTSYAGIERTFAMCDLPPTGASKSDELVAQVRNGYYPGRSGQVYAHWSRYWYKGSKLAGHGAAYDYDQHVPVMFMGPGIQPGRHTEPVSPSNMAATICAVLGIAPPNPACAPPLAKALSAATH